MKRFTKHLHRITPNLAGFFALLAIFLLFLLNPDPLKRVQLQVFDTLQNAAPWNGEGEGKAATLVVDIDEASIARHGQWPWPRTDLALMNERLGKAGAKVVAYDIVFSESDRTSPEMLAHRYDSKQLADTLAALPSHDDIFGQSFVHVPVVLAYFFLPPGNEGANVEPKANFTLSGTMPSANVSAYEGALLPVPPIERVAAGTGFVSLQSDGDGIVRRVPLVAIQNGTLVPSLTLEAIRVAQDKGSPNLLASDGSGETLASPGAAVAVRLEETHIPVNKAGEMWVHYPPDGQIGTLAAWRILSGDISDAELAQLVADKIIFIGGSAEGLQDLVATPQSPSIAGVTVHAAAAQQIVSGHFLQRPDWARTVEGILLLIMGGALAITLPRLGATLGALAALAGIALIGALCWVSFTQWHYLLDPTGPMLAMGAIYVVQTMAAFYREERQRSYIRSAFNRYLSPELVRQIASDPDKLELGGEEREMSVLMCDIRGFSRISEQYSPREVIDFLIEFLTPMSAILLDHKATLDKYIGDAILAFWNAPLDDPDHPRNAARAALEMISTVEKLNRDKRLADETLWPGEVEIGIGINSGLCCVGNMGSRERLSYTLIGDTVNVAARLEGLSKQYGAPIIVGEALAHEIEGFALLELDRVQVVGRERATTIFALLGDEALACAKDYRSLRASHQNMLKAYRARDWNTAATLLDQNDQLFEQFGIAKLKQLFTTRIAELRQAPPQTDWDGVFQAKSK